MKPMMKFPWLGAVLGLLAWLFILYGFFLEKPKAASAVLVLSLSEQRDSIVAQEARRAGVPVALALAVSHVENFTGDSAATSPRGAVGIMQVLPKYWQHSFEDECGCGSLIRRQRNACVGVRVLKQYLAEQKTVALALRAYHGSLNLPDAGQQYISLVLDKLTTLAPSM